MKKWTSQAPGWKYWSSSTYQRNFFSLQQLLDILVPLFSLCLFSLSVSLRCPIKSASPSFLCCSQRLVWRTMQQSVSLSSLLSQHLICLVPLFQQTCPTGLSFLAPFQVLSQHLPCGMALYLLLSYLHGGGLFVCLFVCLIEFLCPRCKVVIMKISWMFCVWFLNLGDINEHEGLWVWISSSGV